MILLPWDRQPGSLAYQIDWSNPLARNLRHFVTCEGGIPVDLVTSQFLDPQANATLTQPIITEAGYALDNPGAGAVGSGWDVVKADWLWNGASACSVMTLAKSDLNTISTTQNTFSHGGSGADGFECSWLASSTDWRFRIHNGSSLQTDTLSGIIGSGGTYPATQWNILGGTWGSDVVTARVNKSKGTGTATTGTMAVDASAANRPTVGNYSSGGDLGWDGPILFAAAWDRELTDAEWNQLVDNPWQLRQPILLPSVGTAGPAIVITDVDTDETWDDGDTGLVITGTGFV